MFLSESDFIHVIKSAPLFAVDLIIVIDGKILVGRRKNKPAQHYWFVPGGRVLKDEKIDKAIIRICDKELNQSDFIECKNIGLFEHFYRNNFLEVKNCTTHYVTSAYLVKFKNGFNMSLLPTIEHSSYQLVKFQDALQNSRVHKYTKKYIELLIMSNNVTFT